jgi:hypothetical protein
MVISSLVGEILHKKTYILFLYKRLYLLRSEYYTKNDYEKNEIDLLKVETDMKISRAKIFVKEKEIILKEILDGKSRGNFYS